ncbi:PREDICTED: probable 39S ribosomal protein L49, mitochondrial [Dinoponera quadriceps]|uniref:Large ribosomal subunit protein mL49 n=1 Tax=Dinoponera quadriceps TaxID=609295 RepID=A0A6P3XCN1_DINQU|nr:PREDICTED: probable 39S ribosomal protein L49, mitochondrial [Dinoponera quadriceps]
MAALRIFTRVGPAAILSPGRSLSGAIAPIVDQIQCRWSSYKSSPWYTKPENYTDYEITKDPNEWKYVERLLPYKTIPKPPTGDVKLPSGWKPPRASPTDYPYFIERSPSYQYPVYLKRKYNGMLKITTVRRIQGDIWALERDLRSYVEQYSDRVIGTQIHEFSSKIKFRGDHVSRIKQWMEMKGF